MASMPLAVSWRERSQSPKQEAGALGDPVDGDRHLLDDWELSADPLRLDAGALHHAMKIDAHLMHGAGDLGDAIGGELADLGEALGGLGELTGGGGDFGGTLATSRTRVSRPLRIWTKAWPRVS